MGIAIYLILAVVTQQQQQQQRKVGIVIHGVSRRVARHSRSQVVVVCLNYHNNNNTCWPFFSELFAALAAFLHANTSATPPQQLKAECGTPMHPTVLHPCIPPGVCEVSEREMGQTAPQQPQQQ